MILSKLQSIFFFLLTPLYLGVVYYKTVFNVDINGLLALSLFILTFYLPIHILLNKNNQFMSISSLLNNKETIKYFSTIFPIIILVILALGTTLILSINNFTLDYYYLNISFLIVSYILWIVLTHKIFLIWIQNDCALFLQITLLLFFTLSLFLASFIFEISQEFNTLYILGFFHNLTKTLLLVIFLMPSLILYLLGILKYKESSLKHKLALTSFIFTPFGFLISLVFLTILIECILEFTSAFDSYTKAILLTLGMILISAVGSYFQLHLFTNMFFKKYKKLTHILFLSFYVLMVVNILLYDSINGMSQKIYEENKLNEHINKYYNSKKTNSFSSTINLTNQKYNWVKCNFSIFGYNSRNTLRGRYPGLSFVMSAACVISLVYKGLWCKKMHKTNKK